MAAKKIPHLRSLVVRIVSGGQTGADRAALDWAIAHGIAHGGWCPPGRLAEDGVIDARYKLTELASGGYRQRTRMNVDYSDGTLILNLGELDGGTLETQRFAERHKKPWLVLQLDDGVTGEMTVRATSWLRRHEIKALNVAGPRESKRPGIHAAVTAFLDALDQDYEPPKENIAVVKGKPKGPSTYTPPAPYRIGRHGRSRKSA